MRQSEIGDWYAARPGDALRDLDVTLKAEAVTHSMQGMVYARLAQLLAWMRISETAADYYELQQHLFHDVYELEEARSKWYSQWRAYGTENRPRESIELIQPEAPEDEASWRREIFVRERFIRQLRARRGWHGLALLRVRSTPDPRPLVQQRAGADVWAIGLEHELGRVVSLWKRGAPLRPSARPHDVPAHRGHL